MKDENGRRDRQTDMWIDDGIYLKRQTIFEVEAGNDKDRHIHISGQTYDTVDRRREMMVATKSA